MSSPFRRRAALIGAALLLSACSSEAGGGSAPESAEDTEERIENYAAAVDENCAASPVFERPDLELVTEGEGSHTISTDEGDVEVPNAPQAALGFYTTDLDTLLTLGVPLAQSLPSREGYKTWPCFFPHDALATHDTFVNYPEYNYEAVLVAEPDFILNGLGHDPEVGKRLAEIAPTYSEKWYDGRSWREHFETIARNLGRLDHYEAYQEFYEARVTEVRAEIEAAQGRPTGEIVVASVQDWDGVAVTCSYGLECEVFDDLGLVTHPLALVKDGEGALLSDEQVGQVAELDYAFVPVGVEELVDGLDAGWLRRLAKNTLWTDLPFVQDRAVATYEWEITFGGASAQLAFLEVVRQLLTS